MRLTIVGTNLPGRRFCRQDGTTMDNVHVGIQLRREPGQLIRADAGDAVWQTNVDAIAKNGALDFRGPAVQGKSGERFIYLTWGDVRPGGGFETFRRAKLVLDRVASDVMESAVLADRLTAMVDLTDDCGGPRCARVDPPHIVWSVPSR